MCGGAMRGDPKGAGVLTTRKRYSREKHRQTDAFYAASPPTGYLPPEKAIFVPIITRKRNINTLR